MSVLDDRADLGKALAGVGSVTLACVDPAYGKVPAKMR